MSTPSTLYVAPDQPGAIGVCDIRDDGSLGAPVLIESVQGAGSLAQHGRFLFSTSTENDGSVAIFAFVPGGLQPQGRVSSGGVEPCHLAVSPNGTQLVITNYASGTLTIRDLHDGLPGEITDQFTAFGSGPIPDRQSSAHLHQARFHPDTGVLLVTDLGADMLRGFILDEELGTLQQVPDWTCPAPAGSGPRHLQFLPDGAVLVADELSATVSRYARNGALRWESSTPSTRKVLPIANYPSEIVLGPDARFAYVANRGFDTIGIIAIRGPEIEFVSETASLGEWPQHLLVHRDVLYCANRNSNTINTFAIDHATGELMPTGDPRAFTRPSWLLAVTR